MYGFMRRDFLLLRRCYSYCGKNNCKNMAKSTNFVNILTDVRNEGNLAYVFKSRNFPSRQNGKFRNALQMKRDVIASQRIQTVMEEIVKTRNLPKKDVEIEASQICDEMFLNIDMKAVRILAYLAKRILPRLFSSIYVDSAEKVENIRRLCERDSVLFVPSHRSYMDFILLQFVCLHCEISLPAIASGIDFMRMKLFGELLRRSGAYFIRRSFKDNPLYMAIFTEYVQNLALDGERPTEVFVEGTRSRTGKSLRPKHGFLSTILELYLSNRIVDLKVIPVNISYSKTLEEVLYAYELLGFSKPAESTSALFKARTVLDQNYGDAFITFCEPISVRQYFDKMAGIDRSLHKPYLPFKFTDSEKRAVHLFSHDLIKVQESKAVLNLWMLVSLEINNVLAHVDFNIEKPVYINRDHIQQGVSRWYDLFSRLSCHIPLRTGSLVDEFAYFANLHKNLITIDDGGRLLKLPFAPPPAANATDRSVEGVRKLIPVAVPGLIFTNFANQCMHVLGNVCYLAVNFNSKNRNEFSNVQKLAEEFSFLKIFFGREFVYEQMKIQQNFNEALNVAAKARIFEIDSSSNVKVLNEMDVVILKRVFEPFLVGYYLAVDFMIGFRLEIDENLFVKRMQEMLSEKLLSKNNGFPKWYQIMSSDTLKNSLHAMVDVGAIKKVHSNSSLVVYAGDYVRLVDIKRRLNTYLDNCEVNVEEFVKKAALTSKL